MKAYWPQRVYVSEEANNDELTKRVLSRLGAIDLQQLPTGVDPLGGKELSNAADAARFSQGKRQLLLTRHHGSWLQYCPGTGQHVCCNLWIVNPGEGCPLDCSYCYLQSYLRRNPTLKLYTNITAMLSEIATSLDAQPDRLFRVCTGEVMDSLVWDDLSDLSCDLIPFFARRENAILELKTKSAVISNVLALRSEHRGRTVVSWSVNARAVTEHDELLTATLDERIAAAGKVVDAGYRVGFHFDPVIDFEGWQDGYRDLIREVFQSIPVDRVAWVSVSTLRYRRDMQELMRIRFPESGISYGEQFLAKDSKLRYIQPLRFQLLEFMMKELRAVSQQMPVYMCMESSAAWRQLTGGAPAAGSELSEVFSRRGKLPIVAQNVAACDVR